MENKNYRNENRVWAGLFIVAAGGLMLAYKMGFPVPTWIFSWEVLLIAIGVLVGIKHNFRNAGWIILIGIGSFFLLEREMPEFGLREYIWPLVVIAVGILFIVRPARSCKSEKWQRKWQDKWEARNPGGFATDFTDTTSSATGDDAIYINSVFSGVKRSVFSKNFKGGKISHVFGGSEIDFMQADIQGTAVLYLEQVFGGLKLIVPQCWTVKNEIDGVFHGVDDKRSSFTQTSTDPNKILVLKGSSVFAGIEIKSY